jgi:diguanylate cyclase (GGDEF)-like protein/PAS domain S-box-containing protein
MSIIQKRKVHLIKQTNRGIIRRFIIGLVLILIALLAVGYIKTTLSAKAMETNRLVSRTYDVIAETKSLMRIFQNIRLAERGYLLTGERKFLEDIGVNTYSFDQHQIRLGILTVDNDLQQSKIKMLKLSFDSLIEQAVQPLLQHRDTYADNPEELFASNKMPSLMDNSQFIADQLESILTDIENAEYQLLEEHQQQLNYWYTLDSWLSFLEPFFIILVTFLAGWGAILRLDRYQKQQQKDQKQLTEARDLFAGVIQASELGSWEWNIPLETIQINETWAELLGYSKQELEPFTFTAFQKMVEPSDLPHLQTSLETHFNHTLSTFSCDLRMRHKDGHLVWILSKGKVIRRDAEGNPVLMIGTHADISQRIADAEALARSEAESRKLFEAMNQGFAYCRILLDDTGKPNDFTLLRVNENFELQTGLIPKESVGKRITELLGYVEPYWLENNGKVAVSGQSMSYEAFSSSLNRLFRISSFSPEYGYFAMIIDDISQQRNTETQLAFEKKLFETTLRSVGDGVISTDAHGNVQFMNKSAEELTGWRDEEAKGRAFEEVFKILCGKDRQPCPNPVAQVLAKQKAVELAEDTILIARDGFERYIDDSAAPILDEEHAVTGVVLVFRDNTEQRKRQHEMISLSFTDPLTTLHNRRFYDQVKQEMDDEMYYPLTLVLADVDGLKLTNDAFGHEAGDALLCKVAEILRKTCREGDIVSRIGGDEFVLLLPQTDALHAQAIVTRLNAALVKEQIKGIQLSVSFGYAVKQEEESPLEDTFKVAEDVMYQNKLSGSMTFKKEVISTLLERLFSLDATLRTHSQLVADLCAAFAKGLEYPKHKVQDMYLAGLYHDLGKIALDPALLTKPFESLNRSELLEFKRHAEIGYNILRSVGEYASFAQAVLHHHERWDGNGYPQGLRREAIAEEAQILALANNYADLIGPSLTRDTISKEAAIAYLAERSNIVFSPRLIELFVTKVVPNL